jgi:type I restriction enzyme S subunit
MRRFSRGITDFRMRLYWEEFKNVRVAIPPVELLIEIKYYVDEVETRTAELVAAAGECIDLLLERRSALISAAVTGKIDVRGHVHQPAMEAA